MVIDAATICALATSPGRAGIAVIRMSGARALQIAQGVTKKTLSPRIATLCDFYDAHGGVIDRGIALYFVKPYSYTGEDVVEFHCHGSPVITDLMLSELCCMGARIARPGEFTERAFLNNKIDLTQAEAIADLIDSQTEAAARSAVRSMQGEFSSCAQQIVEQLIRVRTHVEANLDFSEEEVPNIVWHAIAQDLKHIARDISKMIKHAQYGARLHEGATVAIVGPPNAGKSSLLNRLSKQEIAIVTPIPGTTRDVLNVDVSLNGMPVRIVDTAGMRESDDPIEREGVRRAQQALENADLILFVIDQAAISAAQAIHEFITRSSNEKRYLVVHNKIDLVSEQPTVADNHIYCSAKTSAGIDLLIHEIQKRLLGELPEGHAVVARRRHVEALKRAAVHMDVALQHVHQQRELELIAEELHCAQQHMQELTGEFTTDELLAEIFSSFCIGK